VVIPRAWHEQTEWEVDLAYEQGYRAGYAQAERDLIGQAQADRAGYPPLPTSTAVIRWLTRTYDQTTRKEAA